LKYIYIYYIPQGSTKSTIILKHLYTPDLMKGEDGYEKFGGSCPPGYSSCSFDILGAKPEGYESKFFMPCIGLRGMNPGGRLLSGRTMVIRCSSPNIDIENGGLEYRLKLVVGGTSVVGCKRGVDLALSGVRSIGSITVLAEGVDKVGED
jgi:hypothetical protein